MSMCHALNMISSWGKGEVKNLLLIRERVNRARQRQVVRFEQHRNMFANADMTVSEIQQFCVMMPEARQLLELSVRRMQLSARAYHRALKLVRTIADLGESDLIEVPHVAEAIQYRPKNQFA